MRNRHRNRGFTLLEMLVVVGIIVLLVGITYPILTRAMSGGAVARLRMDLQAISLALEQYKADHGDYPRNIDAGLTGTPGEPYRGAILLVRALLAPGDESIDGADGFGFRYNVSGQGRVFGPYLKPDSFRIANPDNSAIDETSATAYDYAVLVDKNGMPILYFPGRASKPDISQTGLFVDDRDPGPGAKPLYNRYDNEVLPLAAMRKLLGDTDGNGAINGGETAATTGPFLLWSAGPDRTFGTDDDVTNFNE